MSSAQGFLLFLIVLGAAATALRLVSRTTPTVPYPVLLAIGGILIGLLSQLTGGLRLPPVGPDLILLAFVPGLVFEASLALDLDEMRRRVVHQPAGHGGRVLDGLADRRDGPLRPRPGLGERISARRHRRRHGPDRCGAAPPPDRCPARTRGHPR